MDIQSIVNSGSTRSTAATGAGPRVDSREFLTLLTTQLRHQDPFQPTSNTEFLGQLAQLSQLEEAQSQSEKLETIASATAAGANLQGLSQASSLIGKDVSYLDGNAEKNGVVDKVRFANGGIQLEIGDRLVPLGLVISVAEKV